MFMRKAHSPVTGFSSNFPSSPPISENPFLPQKPQGLLPQKKACSDIPLPAAFLYIQVMDLDLFTEKKADFSRRRAFPPASPLQANAVRKEAALCPQELHTELPFPTNTSLVLLEEGCWAFLKRGRRRLRCGRVCVCLLKCYVLN